MSSSSLSDSIPTNDLVLILLFSRISPDQPFDDWLSIAAECYELSRVLIAPDDLEFLYTKTIEKHGSVHGARQAIAELRQHWKKQAQAKKRLVVVTSSTSASPSREAGASSSSSSSPNQQQQQQDLARRHLSFHQTVAPERLLHTVELFRAVEGFMEFDEPVNGRIRHLITPSAMYSAVVKQPMSLSLIRQDIQKGEIGSWGQLEAALWLMASNCVVFNPPEGPYPSLARRFVHNCMEIVCREAAASSA